MAARLSLIPFALVFGLVSAGVRLPKVEVTTTGECVDNTLYAMYVCKDKADGTKLLVPGSCSKYYTCSGGETNELSCDKFYDPITTECVEESSCVEVDNTDCVIPTPPPCNTCATPSPGPCGSWFNPDDLYGSYVCRGKADGTMLIVPESCSEYYFCIGGHSYRKTCGTTRYFNPKVNACDESSNVYCPM